jgi:hypothetical protein
MRITTRLEVVKEHLTKGMRADYVQDGIDYILYLENKVKELEEFILEQPLTPQPLNKDIDEALEELHLILYVGECDSDEKEYNLEIINTIKQALQEKDNTIESLELRDESQSELIESQRQRIKELEEERNAIKEIVEEWKNTFYISNVEYLKIKEVLNQKEIK